MKDGESLENGMVSGPAAAETRREFLGKAAKSIIGRGILARGVTAPETARAHTCLSNNGACPTYDCCHEHICPAADT